MSFTISVHNLMPIRIQNCFFFFSFNTDSKVNLVILIIRLKIYKMKGHLATLFKEEKYMMSSSLKTFNRIFFTEVKKERSAS